MMGKYWYKNAFIYSLHVKSFRDGNGDGIGDFKGLTMSLDYLAGMGVTCIWLMPFFPSPHKDYGYDISDFLGVDQSYGTLGHIAEFIDEAAERGIRVVIDMVFNHTSIDHPWFQQARKDRNSKYRNYYIWVDEKPPDNREDDVFGHHQDGNWEYDEEAGQYFYHTFYKHQADLNLTNPEVLRELKYILHFWLRLGISGFRMDAVPHMLREKGNEKFEFDPLEIIKGIRSFVEDLRYDAILLAEVNTEPQEYKKFFGGNDDQVHMLFNFYVNNYLFLALARRQATPVIDALNKLPQTTVKEQMGTFVRNHDELDLERLTHEEREEVFNVFAPDQNMRIYGRGIRRRVASMLGNDRKRLELVYSLLFSLPGTPILFYGDELGMGEDLSQDQRNSVRTAMQWSLEKNGGFSIVNSNVKVPIIESGDFGYKKVNVQDQLRDPSSLLSWFERVISVRKECIEFGFGDHEIHPVKNPSILLHCCTWNNGHALAIHNFSDQRCSVDVPLKAELKEHLVEVFSDEVYPAFENTRLEIGPYGYRWFRKSPLYAS